MAVLNNTRKRPKVYYGWWVLTVTMVVGFMAAVNAQLFLGVMLPFIQEDTGWSRTSITGAVTLGSMTAGLIAPFVGRLADRHGPRVLSSVGLVLMVGSLFVIGGVANLATFYVAYIIGRSVSQNTLSGVVPRTTAVNWFRRMRGRAMGMTQMALPLGGAVLTLVAQAMIGGGLSWRTVYFIFGAIILVTLLPLIVLVLRRRPEDMGLLPDGDAEPSTETTTTGPQRPPAKEEYDWTLQQALRTPTMWYLTLSMGVGVMANGAIGFHQFAYFRDQGIPQVMAAVALSTYSLSGALANGLWGLLIERVSERLIGVGTMLVAAGLCLFLLTVDTFAEAMVFAVLFGLSARGESSIIMMMQAHYYGRKSFGVISGFSTPFQQIGLGLGPTLAAIPYDLTGTYTIAFVTFAGVYVVAGALIWLAKRPALPREALRENAAESSGTRADT